MIKLIRTSANQDLGGPVIFFMTCMTLDEFRDFEAWCDEHLKGPFGLAEPNFLIYSAGPLTGQVARSHMPKAFTLLVYERSEAVLVKMTWAS